MMILGDVYGYAATNGFVKKRQILCPLGYKIADVYDFMTVNAGNRIDGTGQSRRQILVNLRPQGATCLSKAMALRTSASGTSQSRATHVGRLFDPSSDLETTVAGKKTGPVNTH